MNCAECVVGRGSHDGRILIISVVLIFMLISLDNGFWVEFKVSKDFCEFFDDLMVLRFLFSSDRPSLEFLDSVVPDSILGSKWPSQNRTVLSVKSM
mgnify:CR=1 FL=1